MKTRTQFLLIMAIAVVIAFAACHKSVSSGPSNAVRTQVMTATNSLDQFSRADDADYDMENGTGEFAGAGLTPGCFSVTYDPSKDVYPHTKTLDFTGCPTRSGKVIITVYQPFGSEGLISSKTYDNYYLNGIHIEGTVTITGSGGVLIHEFDKKFTAPDNDVKSWHGTLYVTRIQFNGEDAVQITGFGNGKEAIGGVDVQHFKASIVDADPVIRQLSCGWRTKGSVSVGIVSAHGEEIHTSEILNYGDGTCDDSGWLSVDGGAPFEVDLPFFFWPLG